MPCTPPQRTDSLAGMVPIYTSVTMLEVQNIGPQADNRAIKYARHLLAETPVSRLFMSDFATARNSNTQVEVSRTALNILPYNGDAICLELCFIRSHF